MIVLLHSENHIFLLSDFHLNNPWSCGSLVLVISSVSTVILSGQVVAKCFCCRCGFNNTN